MDVKVSNINEIGSFRKCVFSGNGLEYSIPIILKSFKDVNDINNFKLIHPNKHTINASTNFEYILGAKQKVVFTIYQIKYKKVSYKEYKFFFNQKAKK